jgi:hypothetical protein
MNMQQIARDYKETVENRLRHDPAYAAALLDEAISLFLSGEPVTARLILRDLVNATVGFEKLALETAPYAVCRRKPYNEQSDPHHRHPASESQCEH